MSKNKKASRHSKNISKKEERVVTGVFDSNSQGFGFVKVEGFERDLFIPRGKCADAVFSDMVEVKILSDRGDSQRKRMEAEVIRVVKRGLTHVVGTFHTVRGIVNAKDGVVVGTVTPDNKKIPFFIEIIGSNTKSAVDGHKVVAHITDYRKSGENPRGEVTEVLGHITDPGVDILSIVRSFQLPVDFPEEVQTEADRLPGSIDEGVQKGWYKNRLDLRKVPTVTIDGEDTKDIDDAISLENSCGKGKWRLGVHIADVAEYVLEGRELDKEALKRGTSVYLADRVIPMLPRKLSNGICSLNAGVDRLALSCIMEISASGEVVDYEICESIIHVDARLSYNGVMRLFTLSDESEIAESLRGQGYRGVKTRTLQIARMLRKMRKVATALHTRKSLRGAIDFDFPEAQIKLNSVGHPVDIQIRGRNEATELIEDFMLAANETVARHAYSLEFPFVYRSHLAPSADKLAQLSAFTQKFGFILRTGGSDVHPRKVQQLLEKFKGTSKEAMLSRITLRSMQKAQYTTTCDGHFGLALEHYCHFTSPIRRYPDLQIHRILKYSMQGSLTGKKIHRLEAVLPKVAMHSSDTEQRAAEAERETVKQKKAEFMTDHIGEQYMGSVSGVTGWGVYVELDNTVEGMIRISDLTDDFYAFDAEKFILYGERFGREIALGDRMKIQVVAADPLTRTIDFVEVREEEANSTPSDQAGARVCKQHPEDASTERALKKKRRQNMRQQMDTTGKIKKFKRNRKK